MKEGPSQRSSVVEETHDILERSHMDEFEVAETNQRDSRFKMIDDILMRRGQRRDRYTCNTELSLELEGGD